MEISEAHEQHNKKLINSLLMIGAELGNVSRELKLIREKLYEKKAESAAQ